MTDYSAKTWIGLHIQYNGQHGVVKNAMFNPGVQPLRLTACMDDGRYVTFNPQQDPTFRVYLNPDAVPTEQ